MRIDINAALMGTGAGRKSNANIVHARTIKQKSITQKSIEILHGQNVNQATRAALFNNSKFRVDTTATTTTGTAGPGGFGLNSSNY